MATLQTPRPGNPPPPEAGEAAVPEPARTVADRPVAAAPPVAAALAEPPAAATATPAAAPPPQAPQPAAAAAAPARPAAAPPPQAPQPTAAAAAPAKPAAAPPPQAPQPTAAAAKPAAAPPPQAPQPAAAPAPKPVATPAVARLPGTPALPALEPSPAPAAPVLDLAIAARRPSAMRRFRGWLGRRSFLLAVVLPTLLAGVYFYGFAAPQFETEARFLVRGRSGGSGGGLSEALQGAGFARASEEAVGVRDYLQSHDVVTALRDRLDLIGIYRRPEADPVARLWWEAPHLERLTDYFNRMVTTEYDMTSGITKLKVKSFRPEDSRELARQLLLLAEDLVNVQNQRMKDDTLRVAREEVARAEARLTAAQAALTGFRDRERAVDLAQSAAVAITNLGQLEAALAQARAELSEAQRFARADAPRVVQLRNRIEGLASQIAEERQRLGRREDGNLTQNLGEFERLQTERELSRVQLASAMASLERAIGDAQRQQVFLLRVVEPNLAEWPRYPKATLNVVYVFLCLSVAYGLAWLLVAGMREHAA